MSTVALADQSGEDLLSPTSPSSVHTLHSSKSSDTLLSTKVQCAIDTPGTKRKPWTPLRVLNRVWKLFKYVYSCALLGVTLGICLYNIACGTSMFFSVPEWLQYILLVVFLFLLETCEGAMIALSQLRRVSAASYAKSHPATFRNANLAFKPDYLEKFLMGRQANVVVLVFMLSRLLATSTSVNSVGTLGAWIISGFLQTGLFGAFVVLILGNLVPQVTAAKFPVQFMNSIWFYFVICWCLFIRFIGLTHACWLCAKSIAFVLGLDWNAPPLAIGQTKSDENGEESVGLEGTGTDKIYAMDYQQFLDKHALSIPLRSLKIDLSQGVRKVIAASNTPEEQSSLRWANPEHIADIYTRHSLDVPEFLRPANQPGYEPAHIKAIQLIVENQRLLKAIQDANIDLSSAEKQAVTTPLYTSLKPVVDVAALDRLQLVAVA